MSTQAIERLDNETIDALEDVIENMCKERNSNSQTKPSQESRQEMAELAGWCSLEDVLSLIKEAKASRPSVARPVANPSSTGLVFPSEQKAISVLKAYDLQRSVIDRLQPVRFSNPDTFMLYPEIVKARAFKLINNFNVMAELSQAFWTGMGWRSSSDWLYPRSEVEVSIDHIGSPYYAKQCQKLILLADTYPGPEVEVEDPPMKTYLRSFDDLMENILGGYVQAKSSLQTIVLFVEPALVRNLEDAFGGNL